MAASNRPAAASKAAGSMASRLACSVSNSPWKAASPSPSRASTAARGSSAPSRVAGRPGAAWAVPPTRFSIRIWARSPRVVLRPWGLASSWASWSTRAWRLST